MEVALMCSRSLHVQGRFLAQMRKIPDPSISIILGLAPCSSSMGCGWAAAAKARIDAAGPSDDARAFNPKWDSSRCPPARSMLAPDDQPECWGVNERW